MSSTEAKRPVDPATAYAIALGASSEPSQQGPNNEPTEHTLFNFSPEIHSLPGN